MDLTLRPHPSGNPAMREILEGKRRIGYCTLKAGYPVTMIASCSESELVCVRDFVNSQIEGTVGDVLQPPSDQEIAAALGEDDDDDDDE